MINTRVMNRKLLKEKELEIESLKCALQDITRKYEILSKATNDAIWDWDIQANSIQWNHGLKSIFGHNELNTSRSVWLENLHPLDKQEVLDGICGTFRDHKLNWSAIYRYRCSNNTYKWAYDRAFIVYDNASPTRMIGAMQDIDERMTSLEEIEKLSLVASKTENLVIITDANQNIEWVNEGFTRKTGYTLHDVVGKKPSILYGPETNTESLERISECNSRGESSTEELLKYTRDGSKFWVRVTINPVFNEYNKLFKFVAIETDVTIRKENENKIKAIAQELSDLIENANAIILGVDVNGFVNEWNKEATRVTGYEKDELIGKKLIEFVVGKTRQNMVGSYIQHVLNGNSIDLMEFEIISRNGDHEMLLLSITPRKNSTGEIIGLIAVGQDITELSEYRQSLEKKVRERTRELKKSLEKEKELAQVKSQFASIVSHEFRTPLSTIKVSASHIKKYKARMTDIEIDRKIDVMLKQVEHMTHLLEDVLSLGSTERTSIQITQVPVQLVEFFKVLKDEVQQLNNGSHEVRLYFDIIDQVLYTDADLLRNIFINLLNNAIKFSPDKNEILLNILQNNQEYKIVVSDEGIGFPMDNAVKIFDSFYRAPNASSIKGTGLGLTIAKKAVDLIGGTIHACRTDKIELNFT